MSVGPVMLFMQPGPQDHQAEQGYALCMMQEGGSYADVGVNVPYVMVADGQSPEHWVHHAVDGSAIAGGSTTSKAFDIKNPKTGKKLDREDLLDKGGVQGGVLSPAFKAKWAAAAKVVASRMRSHRWCADHSTFSALNVDGICHPRPGRGLGHRRPVAQWRHGADAAREVPQQKLPPAAEAAEAPAPSLKDFRIPQGEKVSAKTAANIAALSLESCTEKKLAHHSSVGSRPWRPKCMQGKEGADVQQEELPTSAAESSPSLQEGSDAASGEDESPVRVVAKASEAPFRELLAFRFAVSSEVPVGVETLAARECPEAPEVEKLQRMCSSGQEEPTHRALFGTASSRRHHAATPTRGSQERTPKASLPAPSATAYRAVSDRSPASLPRLEEMRRTVQSLLNKICPENVATIAEQIGEVRIENADEMESIIGLIFKKALAEPHYCETYADLVFTLRSTFPEFPSLDGSKPISFKATLLNICQTEFEALPTSLAPTAEEMEKYDASELDFRRKKRKDRVLSNMKFIGHLFLRQLLSAKVIGSVIQELTLCNCADQVPEEHVIECAVELLLAIGYTLESMPAGSKALGQVCGRLLDLKNTRRGGKAVYCKRVQFNIQDLLDARQKGWARKVFSGVAKTKEEIRIEQEKELSAAARGKEIASGERVVAGQRPTYLSGVGKDASPH